MRRVGCESNATDEELPLPAPVNPEESFPSTQKHFHRDCHRQQSHQPLEGDEHPLAQPTDPGQTLLLV